MKNLKHFTLLLLVSLFVAGPASVKAVMVVESNDAETAVVATKEMKNQKLLEKVMDKIQKKIEKRQDKIQEKLEKRAAKRAAKGKAVDFSDPVEKWLWYAVFGWGAAIVLWIIGVILASTLTYSGFGLAGVLFLLSSLVGLFGTVAFVLWLVKKFGDA